MNELVEKIRATKAQIVIARKQYNQAARLLTRLMVSLEKLEEKDELARIKFKAKSSH